MSAVTSVSFCLVVFFLVCSSEAQVIIPVELGQDVTLPCKAPSNKPIKAVQLSRPELDPDHVLLYWDGHFVQDNQHPSYKNRVDLKDREMKDGDASLVLKNVKMEDRGTYECRVDQGETNRRKRSTLTSDPIKIIYLEVYSSVPDIIRVKHGEDVSLRCKASNSKTIRAVEWSRPGLEPNHVLVYRDGHFDSENQLLSYKNRVDLKDREMKDRDASLVLKNVKMEDEGRYECWVGQGETNRRKRSSSTNDPINVIYLEVGPPGDKDGNTGDGWNEVGIILGVVGFLLTAMALVGSLIYRISMRQKSDLHVPPDEPAGKKTPHPIVDTPSRQKTEDQRGRAWSVSGQETVREHQKARVRKCVSEWMVGRGADGADWKPHLSQSAPELHM